MFSRLLFLFFALFITDCVYAAPAPDFSDFLRWRNIGPFRGGRTRAIAGVPSQPNVFYMAQVNGGVFQARTTTGAPGSRFLTINRPASVGALAVATSDPNIIYVGSGEGLASSRSLRRRRHLQIDRCGQNLDASRLARWPADRADRGRSRAIPDICSWRSPGTLTGLTRSAASSFRHDGGKTFAKTLYKDENTGGTDVQIDPANPQIVYASLWEAREGPWENAEWNGTNGGIFKSTDGGKTWQQLSRGLPDDIVQANLAVAPSVPRILFAAVATPKAVKLYRSDDAGENWSLATDDARPAGRIGGGDLAGRAVRSARPEGRLFCERRLLEIDRWRQDLGWLARRARAATIIKTFGSIRTTRRSSCSPATRARSSQSTAARPGAPGITNRPRSFITSARTMRFPYRLYSGQQESGSVGIASRGPNGEITFRDWHPVGAEEYGYVTADPLDPDIVYGGKLTRYDRRTGQAQNILPKPFRSDEFRMVRTEPVIFSPIDPQPAFLRDQHSVADDATAGGTGSRSART